LPAGVVESLVQVLANEGMRSVMLVNGISQAEKANIDQQPLQFFLCSERAPIDLTIQVSESHQQ
jgi:hypothetical protein